MQKMIRDHPGEVTLLTIGPLTNVAALFAADTEMPHLLKEIVSMCGVFKPHLADTFLTEWNAMLDPHATAIVYHSPVKMHRSVGLDVTMQVEKDSGEVRALFQHPRLRPILDFAEIWFQERNSIIFHDPLAAVTIFDPLVCEFEQGEIDIELTSERLAGLTFWKANPSGRHAMATKVNPARFFSSYFSLFQ